jgi:hypothetical protein
MKKMKKFLVLSLTVAMVAANGITAFAGSSSKSTTGYGTLYGSLTSSGSYVTQVDKNNDNAQLTISGEIQNKAGKTLVSKQTIYSSKGATRYSGKWSGIPSDAYALYGTHGVQNGTQYGSAAVYTVTHVE